MHMVFKLRPEYEGFSGSVLYGSSGETLYFPDDINDGTIVTDNPLQISALAGLQGAEGAVFNVFTDDGEGNLSPYEPASRPSSDALPKPVPETMAPVPAVGAVHDESASAYAGLTNAELADTARDRGLQVAARATKEELIGMLEANDLQDVGPPAADDNTVSEEV